MSDQIITLSNAIRREVPERAWYQEARGGVAHLIISGEGMDGGQSLCGYTLRELSHSAVAKHCVGCTKRLTRFAEAAVVEHEWIKETVSVTVIRPVVDNSNDTVQNKVSLALARKGTWVVGEVEADIEPFVPPEPIRVEELPDRPVGTVIHG